MQFKDVIYIFCYQEHLKHFLENYVFCQKSGNDTHVMLFASL